MTRDRPDLEVANETRSQVKTASASKRPCQGVEVCVELQCRVQSCKGIDNHDWRLLPLNGYW